MSTLERKCIGWPEQECTTGGWVQGAGAWGLGSFPGERAAPRVNRGRERHSLNANRLAEDRRQLLAFAGDLLNSDHAGHRLKEVCNTFDFSGPLDFVRPASGLSERVGAGRGRLDLRLRARRGSEDRPAIRRDRQPRVDMEATAKGAPQAAREAAGHSTAACNLRSSGSAYCGRSGCGLASNVWR